MKDAIKKNAFYVGCIVAFVVAVLVFTCYCWVAKTFGRADNTVSDGNGVQEVERQLERAGENQRETQAVAGDIAETATNITAGVGRAEEAVRGAEQINSDLAGESDRAGELIAECQSILAGIRKRGETDQTKD